MESAELANQIFQEQGTATTFSYYPGLTVCMNAEQGFQDLSDKYGIHH